MDTARRILITCTVLLGGAVTCSAATAADAPPARLQGDTIVTAAPISFIGGGRVYACRGTAKLSTAGARALGAVAALLLKQKHASSRVRVEVLLPGNSRRVKCQAFGGRRVVARVRRALIRRGVVASRLSTEVITLGCPLNQPKDPIAAPTLVLRLVPRPIPSRRPAGLPTDAPWLDGLVIRLPRRIQFRIGKDRIMRRSLAMLDRLAKFLNDHPEITALEIQGHRACWDGKYALDLTRRRPEAVRAFLIHRGVASARLSARGYREQRPAKCGGGPHNAEAWCRGGVADLSAEGRRHQRRIELVVTKHSP